MTVEGAEEIAAEGSVVAARDCLLAGVGRAERLQKAGEPWAETLRQEYLMALTVLEQRSPAEALPVPTVPVPWQSAGSKPGVSSASVGDTLEFE